MNSGIIIGIILASIGGIGGIYSIFTIVNDTSGIVYYSYTSPLTTHESTVIAILVVAFLLFIFGITSIIVNSK